jgi:ubiquinone/menaquinone biosynthesis C-methylase UbiE
MDLKTDLYEDQVASYKQRLFKRLRALTPTENAVVIELGIGSFPNAPYYMGWNAQIIGIEPDPSRHAEAMSRAALCGLSLRVYPGRAEHLDIMPPHSADAVVSTCTLCTVDDPQKTLAEVKRVLRADGVFAFLEHVISESDQLLAARQVEATPNELRLWNCHLDRRTLREIQTAGFSRIVGVVDGDACYFDVPTASDLMSPTVVGIALP